MRYVLVVGLLLLAVPACTVPRQSSPQTSTARTPPAASYDGQVPPGGPGGIAAVAALSESDAWAVGTHEPLPKGIYPLTWHWDGHRWTVVPCPSPRDDGQPVRSSLTAVAIDAPNDAWAVGDWTPIVHAPSAYALIEHWNGAKWSIVPVPRSHGHAAGGFSAVAALSPTEVWAFGGSVLMRWNGTRWRYLPSPPRRGQGTDLTGMTVISAHDIWVVGTTGVEKYHSLTEHWDGSKWTVVPTPDTIDGRPRNSNLFAVGGTSSSNVWAVGWYQSGPLGVDHSTLTEHWDGTRWQVQPSPDGSRSKENSQLFAVAALSRTTAWAVGTNEGPIPLIEHWDGVRWTAMRSRTRPKLLVPALYDVVAVDPRYAWACGGGELLEKWNGTNWQQVPSPIP